MRLLIAACLLLGLSAAAREVTLPVWQTSTGHTELVFNTELLDALGLSVLCPSNAPAGKEAIRLEIDPASSVKFTAPKGVPETFLGGFIDNGGSCTLRRTDTAIVSAPIVFFALKDTAALELRDEEADPTLMVTDATVEFAPLMHRLVLQSGHLVISGPLALRLGCPDWAGLVIGAFSCSAQVQELGEPVKQYVRDAAGSSGLRQAPEIQTVQLLGRASDPFRMRLGIKVRWPAAGRSEPEATVEAALSMGELAATSAAPVRCGGFAPVDFPEGALTNGAVITAFASKDGAGATNLFRIIRDSGPPLFIPGP